MPLFPALICCELSHAILAAGNFSDCELTFISSEVRQKVVKRLLRMASSNLANIMQATRTKPAQVIPFGLSQTRVAIVAACSCYRYSHRFATCG